MTASIILVSIVVLSLLWPHSMKHFFNEHIIIKLLLKHNEEF